MKLIREDIIIFIICLITLEFCLCEIKVTSAHGKLCKEICDEFGGQCLEENICQCKDSYTTLPSDNNYKFCNYQKKSKIIAAVIELFIGFGIGHFYALRNVYGYLKLMIYFILCCIGCCSVAIGVKFEQEYPNTENHAVKFFFCIYASILNFIVTWQLFDFFMIMFGVYYDGNNIPFN